MKRFETAVNLIKSGEKSYVCYSGIHRKYFPKWNGWRLIDDGEADFDTLDKLVDDFYYMYFWLKLRLDLIQDPLVAELMLYFAVQHGKKKAISKLARVAGVNTEFMSDGLITAVNNSDLFLELYAECIEFCIRYNKLDDLPSLLSIYYKYNLD